MGLSGVKKRSKLSHDPNNTAWAKSTTNFGHKILSKQGWKPGDYLGAENASHSEHYTAANASHIRVMLREDNLGLGAQVGKGNAETFGLSMFSGLLGRLNGKSEGEVEKQQSLIRDAEVRSYVGQKYGFMNFVSGGLLVGDKIEEKPLKEVVAVKEKVEGDKSSKKRKARELDDEDALTAKAERKKQRKSKPEDEEDMKSSKKEKQRKVTRQERTRVKERSKYEAATEPDLPETSSDSESMSKTMKKKQQTIKSDEGKAKDDIKASLNRDEKACLKEEKRARKEERRKRREEKRLKRAAKGAAETAKSTQVSTVPSDDEGTISPPVQNAFVGRQAVRQRYIQSKRMASMDPKALREIFMMQAKAAA